MNMKEKTGSTVLIKLAYPTQSHPSLITPINPFFVSWNIMVKKQRLISPPKVTLLSNSAKQLYAVDFRRAEPAVLSVGSAASQIRKPLMSANRTKGTGGADGLLPTTADLSPRYVWVMTAQHACGRGPTTEGAKRFLLCATNSRDWVEHRQTDRSSFQITSKDRSCFLIMSSATTVHGRPPSPQSLLNAKPYSLALA